MDNDTTLKWLATPEGAQELARRVGGVQSFWNEGSGAAEAVRNLIQKTIEERKDLGDIKLRINPGPPGGYFPNSDTIALGVSNPAVAAHELGHAKNIRNSKVYGKLLQAANHLANINNVVAIPAMLGIRAFVGDEDVRNEILNVLSGTSAALAAPGLVEELSASVDAVKESPNKLQAIKTLGPAFLTHLFKSTLPVGIYQLGRHM